MTRGLPDQLITALAHGPARDTWQHVPIYEYECKKCHKRFDYLQAISEPPKKKCEKCGGALTKQISAAGFILKGGGWYKDLYASAKPGGGSDSGEGGDKGEKADKSEKADKGEKVDKVAKADKPEKSKKGKKE
jgi:putative FmdB family regulatory protein